MAAGDSVTTKNIDKLTGVVWQWVESVDPYEGGTVYRADSLSAGHTFLFLKEGTFVEDYPGGCCRYEGEWALSEDSTQITLRYTDDKRGGDRVTYEIRELSAGTLRLGIRGRHGLVVELYRPAGRAVKEE
jgi:hypothetical protein